MREIWILWYIIMGAIAFGISFPLPHWLGADSAVYPLAADYFRTIACSVPFNFCVMMLSSIIRCAGDTKAPMILNLSINIINVILNFLLIYPTRVVNIFGTEFTIIGADMGVSGAALGSLIALFIVAVCFFIVIYKKESPIKLKFGGISSKDCLMAVLRLGLLYLPWSAALCALHKLAP